MARSVSGRNVQDFFTNPCFAVMKERIEAMKKQFTDDMSSAITEGEMDLAKSLNGQAKGMDKILLMLTDLEQGLRLQAQKRAKDVQP